VLRDLAIGREAENEVVEHLKSLNLTVELNSDKGKLLYYDIVASADADRFTFEVKNDVMSYKTGNVAIEYYNSKSNKPSGVMASQSDFWVHKITGTFFIIKTAYLRSLMTTIKPKKIITSGGDKNSDMYIYCKEILTYEMVELFDIRSIDDLRTMLNN
jgi:hypothetical protein